MDNKTATPIVALVMLLFIGASVTAQKTRVPWPEKGWPLPVSKGSTVTIKVPYGILTTGILKSNYVTGSGETLVINDNGRWKSAGFPMMVEATIKEAQVVKDYKNKDQKHLLVVVQDRLIKYTIYFQPSIGDIDSAFRELFILGPPTSPDAVAFDQAYTNARRAEWFTGPLASLDDKKKDALLEIAKSYNGSIKHETFKGTQYLVVNLGNGVDVYNDLRTGPSERAAFWINGALLKALKSIEEIIAEDTRFAGIKIETNLAHKDFTYEHSDPDYEQFQMYVPTALIVKFREADITSQALVDGSIIIIDGNRTQVTLSGSK